MAKRPSLLILHRRVVKAAQMATASTPGTKTAEARWKAYEHAEDKFEAALPKNERNDPADR